MSSPAATAAAARPSASRRARWREVGPLGARTPGRAPGSAGPPPRVRMLRDAFPASRRASSPTAGCCRGRVRRGGGARAARERRAWRGGRRVAAEVGLRWVVEALVGGLRLRGAAGRGPARRPQGQRRAAGGGGAAAGGERRPVLVGHGLFGDVIYLCENFLWELPATVEEFGGMLSDVWPMAVDTEYMASQWFTVDGAETASLGQVEEALCEQEEPVMCELFRGLPTARVLASRGRRLQQVSPHRQHARGAAAAACLMARVVILLLSARLCRDARFRTRFLTRALHHRDPVLEMLPFDHVFWDVRGNRMRVFGAEECFLRAGRFVESP